MKQMQKFLAAGTAILLVCSLASCGGKKAENETSSAPAVTSEITSEVSSEADTSDVSETTTSAAESDDGQDATAASPANNSSGLSSSKSSGGSKSSSSKSSGGSSSKSQSSGSQKPNSKPADQPAQTQPESVWTQAEVDALVAEIKAYAQSKGFTINSSLTTEGTSWSNPVHTGKDKAKTKADLKYDIDFVYDLVLQDFGYIPESAALNVFAKSYATNEWEIYVVY